MSRALVVRWGRSPYEQGAALERERARVEGLGFRCLHLPGDAPLRALAGARVLVVTSMKRVGARELDGLPDLQLLLTTTSGYDHLDLRAAAARGVAVARMPLARRDAVVETTLAMAMALLRDLLPLQAAAAQGQWVRRRLPEYRVHRVRDATVGVIGLGVIGSRAAQLFQAMGARVVGWDPGRPDLPVLRQSPEQMVAACDVISLHCRLEPGAPAVLDERLLAGATDGLLVLNTARGGVLDLGAAERALSEGRLAGMGLDVFPREPYPRMAALAAHPRVIVTPHAAGYHPGLAGAIADELVGTLTAWRAGCRLPHGLVWENKNRDGEMRGENHHGDR